MNKETTKKFVENNGFICNKCGKVVVDGHKHKNEEDLCDQCKIADLQYQLLLTEKALELVRDRLKDLYCSSYCGRSCDFFCQTEEELKDECKLYYECWNKECVLKQAKEILKNE